MNKKGNIFFGVVLFLLIFGAGVLFMPFISDDITIARANLDCGNSSITSSAKINCIGTDILMPYFIWFFVSAGLSYLFAKD